eukprot:304062-Chlamydomonas_euryale.AAC.17
MPRPPSIKTPLRRASVNPQQSLETAVVCFVNLTSVSRSRGTAYRFVAIWSDSALVLSETGRRFISDFTTHHCCLLSPAPELLDSNTGAEQRRRCAASNAAAACFLAVAHLRARPG